MAPLTLVDLCQFSSAAEMVFFPFSANQIPKHYQQKKAILFLIPVLYGEGMSLSFETPPL